MNNDLLDSIAQGKEVDLRAKQAQDNIDRAKKQYDEGLNNPKANFEVSVNTIQRNMEHRKKLLSIQEAYSKDKAFNDYEQAKKKARIEAKHNLLVSLYSDNQKATDTVGKSPGELMSKGSLDDNKIFKTLVGLNKDLKLAKTNYEGTLKNIELSKQTDLTKLNQEENKLYDDLMIPYAIQLKAALSEQERQRQITTDIMEQNRDLRMHSTMEILSVATNNLLDAERNYGDSWIFGDGGFVEALGQAGGKLADTSWDSVEWLGKSLYTLFKDGKLANYDGNKTFENFMRKLGFNSASLGEAGREYFSIYDRAGLSLLFNQLGHSTPEIVMLGLMGGSIGRGLNLIKSPNMNLLNDFHTRINRAITNARKANNPDLVLILENLKQSVVTQLTKKIPRNQLTSYINSISLKSAEGFLKKYPHLKDEIANIISNPSLARSLQGLSDAAGKQILSRGDLFSIGSLMRRAGRAATTAQDARAGVIALASGITGASFELARRTHMQMEQRGQGAEFTLMDLFSGLNHMAVDFAGVVSMLGGASKLFNKPLFGETSLGLEMNGLKAFAGGGLVEGIGETLQTYWELSSANNYNFPPITSIINDPAKYNKENMMFEESFVLGALMSGMISGPSIAINKIYNKAAEYQLQRQRERIEQILQEQENQQQTGFREEVYDAVTDYNTTQEDLKEAYSNMSDRAREQHQANTKSMYEEAAEAQAQAQAVIDKHINSEKNQANQSTTSQDTDATTDNVEVPDGDIVVSRNNTAAQYALQNKLIQKQEELAEMRRLAQANRNTLTAEEATKMSELETDIAEIQEAITNLDKVDAMYHKQTLNNMIAKELDGNTDTAKEQGLLELQQKIKDAKSNEDIQALMEEIKESPYISFNKKDLEDLQKFYKKEDKKNNRKFSTNAKLDEFEEGENDSYQNLDGSTDNIKDASDESNTTTRQGNFTSPNSGDTSTTVDDDADLNSSTTEDEVEVDDEVESEIEDDTEVEEEVDRSQSIEDALKEIEEQERKGHNEAVRKLVKDLFKTLSFEEQMYLLAKKYNSKQAEKLEQDYVLVKVRDLDSLSASPISPTANQKANKGERTGLVSEKYHYIWVRRHFNDIDLATQAETLTDIIDKAYRKVSQVVGVSLVDKFAAISDIIQQIAKYKKEGRDASDIALLEQQLDSAIQDLQSRVLNYTEDVKELLELYHFLFKNTSDFDLKRIIANNMEVIKKGFLDSVKEFKDIKQEIENIKSNTEPLTENFFHKLTSQIKSKVFKGLFQKARDIIDNPKSPNKAQALQEAFDEVENFINKVEQVFDDANGELYKLAQLMDKTLDKMKLHIDNYFNTQYKYNNIIEIGLPNIDTGGNSLTIEIGQSGQNVLSNILSFVGLLTQGLGFTRSYHKQVARKLIRAMTTYSTKYGELPKSILGFAKMFNTKDDVISYRYKTDTDPYKITLEQLILKNIPLDKLPPSVRDNIKNLPTEVERKAAVAKFINDMFFNKNNPKWKNSIERMIETRLAKLEPLFQASLIGFANALVNSTQVVGVRVGKNYKVLTPESIKESMWNTARGILDIKHLSPQELDMIKNIMWSYASTYFGDMRTNQDLRQNKNGNRVVAEVQYLNDKDNRLGVHDIKGGDVIIDNIVNDSAFKGEGKAVIVVSTSFLSYLKDNYQDSFDVIQMKSNLTKIGNNVSSSLKTILKAIRDINKRRKRLGKKDLINLKANALTKFSLYPKFALEHLAISLGIKLEDIAKLDSNGNVIGLNYDKNIISHKHYKALQDKFKRDKVTKRDIEERQAILTTPERAKENPLNYVPVLVKNEKTGQLEFQFFYFPALTTQNSAYCGHIGFDVTEVSLGESMENYMDKMYSQLREVGSLMSALGNAIYHQTNSQDLAHFDYNTNGNEVNFLKGVFFATAMQGASGRIHFDHPLFSPTSNKWVQSAFTKIPVYSKALHDKTDTTGLDIAQKRRSRYYQDMMSTTNDLDVILGLEIAFSDVFNIDVDKWGKTKFWEDIDKKVKGIRNAINKGKITPAKGARIIQSLYNEYNKALRKGLIYSRDNTEYNDLLNNHFQIAEKFCKVENGVIVSLDTAKLFHAFKKRDKDAIAVYNLISSNYKVGSIPKDRVLQKLQNKRIFDQYAKGNDINVWWLSTYVDGSSTTLAESGLTIQYYEAQKAILKIGNIFTDKDAHIRDIYQAYETLRNEGLISPVKEVEGGKVDGYTGILTTLVAQLEKIKGYSIYASLLLGSGILTRDTAKKVVTPVSYQSKIINAFKARDSKIDAAMRQMVSRFTTHQLSDLIEKVKKDILNNNSIPIQIKDKKFVEALKKELDTKIADYQGKGNAITEAEIQELALYQVVREVLFAEPSQQTKGLNVGKVFDSGGLLTGDYKDFSRRVTKVFGNAVKNDFDYAKLNDYLLTYLEQDRQNIMAFNQVTSIETEEFQEAMNNKSTSITLMKTILALTDFFLPPNERVSNSRAITKPSKISKKSRELTEAFREILTKKMFDSINEYFKVDKKKGKIEGFKNSFLDERFKEISKMLGLSKEEKTEARNNLFKFLSGYYAVYRATNQMVFNTKTAYNKIFALHSPLVNQSVNTANSWQITAQNTYQEWVSCMNSIYVSFIRQYSINNNLPQLLDKDLNPNDKEVANYRKKNPMFAYELDTVMRRGYYQLVENLTKRIFCKELLAVLPSVSSLSQIEQKRIKYILSNTNVTTEERLKELIKFSQDTGIGFFEEEMNSIGELYTKAKSFSYTNWDTAFSNVMPLINHSLEAIVTTRILIENNLLKQVYDSLEQAAPLTVASMRKWGQYFAEFMNEHKLTHSDVLLNIQSELTKQIEDVRRDLADKGKIDYDVSKRIHDREMKLKRGINEVKFLRSLLPIAANAVKDFTTLFANINFPHSFQEQFLAQTISDEQQDRINRGELGNPTHIYQTRIVNIIRRTLIAMVNQPSIVDDFLFHKQNKYIDVNGVIYDNPLLPILDLYNKHRFQNVDDVVNFFASNQSEVYQLAQNIGDSLNFISKNPLDIVADTRLTPKDTNNPTIPLESNPFGEVDTSSVTTPNAAVSEVVIGKDVITNEDISRTEQNINIDETKITDEKGSILSDARDKEKTKQEKVESIQKKYNNATPQHKDSVIDITHHNRHLGNMNPQNWSFKNVISSMRTLFEKLFIEEEHKNLSGGYTYDFNNAILSGDITTIRELQLANMKRKLHMYIDKMTDDELTSFSSNINTIDKHIVAENVVKPYLHQVVRNIEKYPSILHYTNGEIIIRIPPSRTDKPIDYQDANGTPLKKIVPYNGGDLVIRPKRLDKDGNLTNENALAVDFYNEFLVTFKAILHSENVDKTDFSEMLKEALKSISAIKLMPDIATRQNKLGEPNLVMTAPHNREPNPLEAILINDVYVSIGGRGLVYQLYKDLVKAYNEVRPEENLDFEDLSNMTLEDQESRISKLTPIPRNKPSISTAIKERQDKKEVAKKQTSTDEEFKANKPYTNDEEVKKKSSEIDSSETPKRQSISIARQHANNNNPTGSTTSAQNNLTNRRASIQRLRADLRQDRASLTAEEKDIEEVFDFAETNLELIEDTTEYVSSNQSAQDSGYTEVYNYEMDDNGKVSEQTGTTIYVFPNNRNFDKFTRLHETLHALTMIAMSHPATRTLMASLTSIFNQVRDYLLANPQEMERLLGGHPNFTAQERFDYIFNVNKDDARNPYRRQAEFIATFLSEPKLYKFLKEFKLDTNYANLKSNTLVGKVGNIIRRILEAIGNAIFRIFTGSSLNVTNAGAEVLHISKMLSNFASYTNIENNKSNRMMGKVEKVEDILQDGILRPLFHMATLGIFKSIGARIKEGTLTQDEVDLAKLDVKFSLRQKDINMQNVVKYLRNPDISKPAKYAMVTTLVISHTLQLGKNMLNKPAIRSAFIDLYVRNMQILTEGTIFDTQIFQDLGLYRGDSFMKRYNQLFEDIAGKNQYIVANSERFASQLRDYSLKLIRESKLVKSLNMTEKEIEELDTHLGNIIWKLGLGDSVREGITYKDGKKETTNETLNEMTSHLLGYKSGNASYNSLLGQTASEMSSYFQQYLKDLIGEGKDTGIKLTIKDKDRILNFINRATNDLALQRVQGYSYSDMGFTNAEQVIDMALKAFMLDKARKNKSKEVVDRIENHIRYGKTSIMSNKHLANNIRRISMLKAIEVLKTHSIYDMNKSVRYFQALKRKLEDKNLDGNIVKDLLHNLSKERNAILDVTRKELQLDYKTAFKYIQKGYKLTDKRIQDKIYTLQSRFGDSVKGFHHYDNYTPYSFNPDVSIVKIYKKNKDYNEQKIQLENLGYVKVYDFVVGEIYKYDGIINYNQTTNNYGFIHNNDAPLGNISGLIQNDFEEQSLELDEIKHQTIGWGKAMIRDYYHRHQPLDAYIQEAINLRFNKPDESTITRVANSLVKYRAVLPREIYEKITEQKVSMSDFMFNATKEAFVKQKRQTINNLTYINLLAQQDELRNREFNHHTVELGEVKEVFNEYTGRDEKRFVFNQNTLEDYGIRLNNDDAKELHNITEMFQKYNEIGDKILVDTRLITYYFGFKPLNLLELVSPKDKEKAANPTIIKAVGWFQTILKKWLKEVRKNTIILNPNLTTQNFISNFMGLLMYRIPFKRIMYDGFKYARELELFLELQKQEAEVVKNLHKQKRGTLKYYEALNKVNHIRKSIESNPIYPLYKEGLYTNLVEDMDERNQIDRGVVKYINNLINKKDNPTISAWIEEGLLTNQSDTYNMLARWNRYGDFIPRVILYYYEREQGTSHREAIRLSRETFIDYTLPLHSKVFRNLDAFGMINYAKYKFRVQRVILKNFTNSPLRALGLVATNELTGINSMSAWLYENLLQDGFSQGILGNLSNMASNTIRYNTITNFPRL